MDPEAAARRFDGEPHMTLVDLECDLLVAGGGPAGVCAALAAARNGAKVVLCQDRSRLGGNSSSARSRCTSSAPTSHTGRPGWREGGLIEEFRLDDAANNPQRCWELWDLLLYDKLVSEPNVTLLLDTTVYAADVTDGRIARVMARCDKTEHLYRIRAENYADCTGDARLALEAGATIRWGHESRDEFNEPLAWDRPTRETLGSSLLFTARDHGRPMPYTAPSWARKVGPEQLRFRPISSWEYGYWWIEWGGATDTIRDNERIRFELLSIVTGVWDYIKNSGDFPDAANWAMDWVGMVPGKRESRRVEGDHILTQHDLMGLTGEPRDAVAIGGWGLDEHPPGGFDAADQRPFVSIKLPEVYNIPLRSLYSKDLANLFIAGRNASCSHVAFTSTRVMATCAVMGQAAGTAAALCTRHGITPRQLAGDDRRVFELQQTLLRDDQTIKGVRNEDPADLARLASVTASGVYQTSKPENVINGFVRDMEGEMNNRWIAPMSADGAWIELAWDEPQTHPPRPADLRHRLPPRADAHVVRLPQRPDDPRPAARDGPRLRDRRHPGRRERGRARPGRGQPPPPPPPRLRAGRGPLGPRPRPGDQRRGHGEDLRGPLLRLRCRPSSAARSSAMATRFEAILAGDDPEHLGAVAAAALEEIARLESILSRHDPAAELARVNREATGRAVTVSVPLFEAIEDCLQWHRSHVGGLRCRPAGLRGRRRPPARPTRARPRPPGRPIPRRPPGDRPRRLRQGAGDRPRRRPRPVVRRRLGPAARRDQLRPGDRPRPGGPAVADRPPRPVRRRRAAGRSASG